MKTSVRFLFAVLAILPVFVFNSCEKKNSTDRNVTGLAAFSFSLNKQAASAKSDSTGTGIVSYQLMVSISDLAGIPVMTDKMIPVYTFGSGFISEKIEIKTGEYNLTKFIVIDQLGQVVFAAPVEGSPLAYITNDPLPVSFIVLADQVTTVVPEVIAVGNYTPGDFGYTNFGIKVVTPLDFYAVCFLDNPLVMAPTQITEAKLTVYSNDGWYYSFYLKAEVNHLVIRGGSDSYTFVLEKAGYITQTLKFTAADLKNTAKENPLGLKIPWGTQYKVLELQPGPDEGKDAMVSNLEPDRNFGNYRYFEATFLSEPVITVMRSNRSLIAFNMDSLPVSAVIRKVSLVLSYDLPVPFDSTFIPGIDSTTGVAFYGAVLQQITEPWDENKVTWNNQPKTIEMNQVYVYPFIKNANIIELDVTGLFLNPSASVLPNYGMLFRLWPDNIFPGFRFASSDYPVPAMRPKLMIYYSN